MGKKFKNVESDKFKDDLYYLLPVNIVLARIHVNIKYLTKLSQTFEFTIHYNLGLQNRKGH